MKEDKLFLKNIDGKGFFSLFQGSCKNPIKRVLSFCKENKKLTKIANFLQIMSAKKKLILFQLQDQSLGISQPTMKNSKITVLLREILKSFREVV